VKVGVTMCTLIAIQDESNEPLSNLTVVSPAFSSEVEMISAEDDDLKMGALKDPVEQ
jgi:hypothetical protein